MIELTRRAWLATAGTIAGAVPLLAAEPKPDGKKAAFKYCLNTSTIRIAEGTWGKSRGIVEAIGIAEKAGYAAIEPWIAELDEFTKGGGTLPDLKKRFADAGLAVPNAIGFAEWIVEDAGKRKKGLEQAKLDMDKVLAISGSQIAAPPTGATGGTSRRDDPKFTEPVNPLVAADRYKDLLEIGKKIGVRPIVEVWGFSRSLSRLGETMLVAMECGRDGGAVLPDVYHLFKGGSDFSGLKLLGANGIGIFHVNDYPRLDRAKIVDADRVYPGDGIAPLPDILASLREMNYQGFLSLELFNPIYWKRDPLEVAKTGLDKLKAIA